MKSTTRPQELRPASGASELGLAGIAELAMGFERSQVLFAASELGVFRNLADGPKSPQELAAALGTEARGIEALLEACVTLRLLRRSSRGYENSRTVGLFLANDGEDSFARVLRFWKRFSYGSWSRLTEAIRQNRPQTANGARTTDLFEHLAADPEELKMFLEGLAGLASWPARRLADTLDLTHRRHLLDVGGGLGTYGEAMARRHPHLNVTLFDLEPVCILAREHLCRNEHAGRIRIVAGDFRVDPLPGPVDCALVSNVLHDWSAEEGRVLLGKVHAALDPGGEIVIHEVMSGEEVAADVALLSLALVVDTRLGRVHSARDIQRWLTDCDFQQIRYQPLGATGIVTGVKNP